MSAHCSLKVSETRLLMLQENALDTQTTAQLRLHIQSCPVCAAYVAAVANCDQLLRRQALPSSVNVYRVQDQMWRDMRKQIMRGTERSSPVHVSRPTVLRSAGALIGVAVVIVLVAQLITFFGRYHLVAQTAAHPLVANITTAVDLTFPTNFRPQYVSPDGQTLIGATFTFNKDPSSDSAGYTDEVDSYSLSTKVMTPLYKAPPRGTATGVVSDGRYVAWMSYTSLQGGGTSPTSALALDLQTMHTQTVASNFTGSDVFALAHGRLIWGDFTTVDSQNSSGAGTLKMTDLAIGATTTLSTSLYENAQSGEVFHLSWPYVIFSMQASPATGSATAAFMNVTTGSTRALTQPEALADLPANVTVGYALLGTTVLESWLEGTNKTIVELTNADQNTNWTVLTTLSKPDYFQATQDAYLQASDRLLFFTGENQVTIAQGTNMNLLAWDRPLRRPVALEINGQSPVLAGLLSMSGNWIILAFPLGRPAADNAGPTASATTGGAATLIDTASLVVK